MVRPAVRFATGGFQWSPASATCIYLPLSTLSELDDASGFEIYVALEAVDMRLAPNLV